MHLYKIVFLCFLWMFGLFGSVNIVHAQEANNQSTTLSAKEQKQLQKQAEKEEKEAKKTEEKLKKQKEKEEKQKKKEEEKKQKNLAQGGNSRRWGWDPIQLMDEFNHGIRRDGELRYTALDDINPSQWTYAYPYRITNTFDAIRQQIHPYIQWIFYLGLSFGVIGIVYNGFLMVTKPFGSDGDLEKVKGRIMSIVKWVMILSGVYLIIQALLSVIAYILS